MQMPLVMTVIGRDRPGLVELVARLVADHSGNWLESRMCRLGGEFAGILRVCVPSDQREALVRALQGLETQGISIVVRPDSAVTPPEIERRGILNIEGQDRPGIVRQITQALARQGVNVEELRTGCESAPMSGETMFKAEAILHLPQSCNLVSLRSELEDIAGDLFVDVTLKEAQD
jgi:glycine cleavage system regulatory protein